MNHKIESALPGFPGFYQGIFENIKYENFNDVGKMYFDKISELLPNISMEFEKVYSPKAYNYSTDSVHILLDLNTSDVKKLDSYKFNEYAGKENTPKAGYVSYCPKDPTDFIEKLENGSEWDKEPLGIHYLNFLLTEKYGNDIYDNITWEIRDEIIENSPYMLDDDFQLEYLGEIHYSPQEELASEVLNYCEFTNLEQAATYLENQLKAYKPAYLFSIVDCPDERATAYLPGAHRVNNIGFLVANRDICQDAVDCALIPNKQCGVWAEYEKNSELNKMYKDVKSLHIDKKASKQNVKETIQPAKSAVKSDPQKDAR